MTSFESVNTGRTGRVYSRGFSPRERFGWGSRCLPWLTGFSVVTCSCSVRHHRCVIAHLVGPPPSGGDNHCDGTPTSGTFAPIKISIVCALNWARATMGSSSGPSPSSIVRVQVLLKNCLRALIFAQRRVGIISFIASGWLNKVHLLHLESLV